jgi:hypothetical protein
MKVLRSTLVAAAAIFAAACGDKVEIVQPNNQNTPTVNSVTVSPASVVMNVGQSVTFTAIVDVSNGAATTVTWSSSGAGVTVTAAGVATAASATPGVAICATSTADATKKGCAQAVVGGGGGTTPASLSIASITAAGGLNVPVPVPPGTVGTSNAAVGGQLDFRMNLVPNSMTPTAVEVLIDGRVAGRQSFTAAQAAALAAEAYAGEQANQVGVATVVISVAINACKTGTGTTENNQVVCGATSTTPAWLNGTRTVSARVTGTMPGSTTATTVNAGQQIQLLFANVSGFIGSLTVTGTNNVGGTGSAVDGAGFKWVAGTVAVTARPVIYTGQTAAIASISLGAVCGGGAAVPNILPNADGTFSATFSSTSTTATGSIAGAAMGVAAACLAAGEMPAITANGNDNDAILLAAGSPANGGAGFLNAFVNLNPDVAFAIRLDNAAPAIGTCLLNAITAPGTLALTGTGTFPTAYPDGAILVGNALSGNQKLNNVTTTDLALISNVRKNGWMNGATIASSTSTGSGLQSGGDRIVTACPDAASGRLQGTAFPTQNKVEVRIGTVGQDNATIDATAPVANFSGVAETSVPTAQYRVRVAVRDLLGNRRTSFNISNVANDGNINNAAAVPVTFHTAQAGVTAGAIGTDPTAARAICNAVASCPAAAVAPGAVSGAAPAPYGATVAAFNIGVDLTPPTLVIGNPLITVVGTTGAPCAGRFTVTAAQPCTVAAIPNTIYIATDPAGAGGVTGSLFYTANPAPMWTAINRRDAGWTNGLLAGQVSGNMWFCDNAAGTTSATTTTLWIASSGSCNTWPTGNYNQGRVAANIGILTQPQDPNAGGPGAVPAPLAAAITPLPVASAAALNFDGYYTQTGFVVDQAGNPTGGATIAPVSNTVVINNGLPALGGVAANQPFLVGGGNVNFVSTAADRLDIAIQRMALEYGAAGVANPAAPGVFGPALIDGATGAAWGTSAAVGDGLQCNAVTASCLVATAQSSWFWQQDQPLNTFANGQNNTPPTGFPLPLGAAPISVNAAFSFPVVGLITNFQLTSAAGVPAGALSAVGVLNTALGQAVNQALTPTPVAAGGSLISPASLPVAPNTPGSVAISATGAANNGPGSFFVCGVTAAAAVLPATCTTAVAPPAAAPVIIPAAGAAGASFAAGGSFTITAIATGATLTFTNPFSQVAFYAYQNATTAGTAGAPARCLASTEGWRLIGISTVANVSDLGGAGVIGAGRNWSYSINWTPNATTAPCFATAGQNYRIMAVGVGGSNLLPTSPGMPGTGLASVISPVSINLIP